MKDKEDLQLTDASYGNEQGVDNPVFVKEDTLPDDLSDSDKESEKDSKSEKESSSCMSKACLPITVTETFFKTHSKIIKYIVLAILAAGYLAYFIYACYLSFQRALALVVLTCLGVFILVCELVFRYKGDSIKRCFKPVQRCFRSNMKWMKWVFIVIVVGLLVAWLAVDTRKRPEQLISFGGVCLFIVAIFLFSAHRTAVRWSTVFWGLGLQFAIGLFVIRTEPGLVAFEWLGKQVQIFLDYTKAGSGFVFGNLIDNIFAFQALPIVVFFSSVMSVLYYLGVMQWVITKISWVMQVTMGTSSTETLSVAGNIFVGQTEAPLLIRPYLKDMTKSEIHAVMTGGFATIAGSVMGAFISFGIDASSLISASVMAAPCALAISKLSYPETEKSKFTSKSQIKVDSGGEQNVLEAVSGGASASIGLVANIAANLIAFLAILGFINATLRWLGGMVGYPDVTFEVRSEIICTYALCGFANFSSLGIVIGGLSSICPPKKGVISSLVLRALFTGTCVSLINACIAGILFVPPLDCVGLLQNAVFEPTTANLETCCYDLFKSTVNNGTVSFEGSWSVVANATIYFENCCGLYNATVCM
ncbi:sodium/nucleoside cotransporter 1 [Danio rerio]|uniref:Si:dkey-24l11.1 protein n=1 Tax=Danio rerio TaxID=7955 RepID=A2RV43_DANRE|nr:sodium/nucleoside cotransporter 1 [Danio rerio]AAI33171.1 Si:dkey-24l11.1 protein [Danio rerio]|eukprot:NP_001074966.1 sodium/nucleoside cotransporter 1 [Danio rerio]